MLSQQSSPTCVVHARGLVKRYGTTLAVDGVDLDVMQGEAFGLLGRNGAGKSTIMRMLNGVTRRSDGALAIFGRDPDADGATVKTSIGVVAQDDRLDLELPVYDNLYVYGRFFGLRRRELHERVERLLGFVRLSEHARRRAGQLSGGMQRRLAIARGLINQPRLLLLDEPTTGLDLQSRESLWSILYELRHEGLTVVLTTHLMEEAERLCSRLLIVDRGRGVLSGSPRELVDDTVPGEALDIRYPRSSHRVMRRELPALTTHHRIGPDRAVLYGRDARQLEAEMGELRARCSSAVVRKSSLEDVFAHATGHALDD